MSEVAASSINSSLRRSISSSHSSWTVQHKIWLLLAEIYLMQDQISSATSCLQEAINIFPLSHHIMYMVRKTFKNYNVTVLGIQHN